MLQPKLPIHLGNDYPMSRSPPMFDSSSPGPDPYHSLQSLHNVYEELHPTRDSDADSEFHAHSDDDFAEDELSLAGETTAVLMATSTSTTASTPNHPEGSSTQSTAMIPTIYHEGNLNYRRMTTGLELATNHTNVERDSVLSLASAVNDRNGAGGDSVSSSSRSSSGATRISRPTEHGTGPYPRSNSKTLNNRDIMSPDMAGLAHNFNQYHNHVNTNNCNSNKRLNSNSNRINNNTIAGHHQHQHQHQHQSSNHQQHGHNAANNNLRSKSRDNICGGGGASCVECRVERQNQVNRQMSSTTHKKRAGSSGVHQQLDQHHPAISTIFHGRTINGNNSHFAYPAPPTNQCPSWVNGNQRMRTMPHAPPNCQQQRMGATSLNHEQPTYDYAQPVFHNGILYDTGFAADVARLQQPVDRSLDCPYIVPEYTSLGSSASGLSAGGNHPQAIYSRDSSFGSDSGYSRGESGGSASGNVLGLGRLKKHTSSSKSIGKSVL